MKVSSELQKEYHFVTYLYFLSYDKVGDFKLKLLKMHNFELETK